MDGPICTGKLPQVLRLKFVYDHRTLKNDEKDRDNRQIMLTKTLSS